MTIYSQSRLAAKAVVVTPGADYGDGTHGIALDARVFEWADEQIVSSAHAGVTFDGTPTELFELARRIDAAVALLVTDGVVPLDGAAFHPEVVEAAKDLTAEAEAIEDVTGTLVDDWSIPEDRARAAVEKFADSGDCNGYATLADAVTENTSYVVAEWMVGEGMVTAIAEAEDPEDDEICHQPGRCRRHGVKMDTTPRGVGVGMSLTDDCGGREVKP